MKASNEKLQDRAVRILMDEVGIVENDATKLMEVAGGDLRVAIVMHKADIAATEARAALASTNYVVEEAVRRVVAEGDNRK